MIIILLVIAFQKPVGGYPNKSLRNIFDEYYNIIIYNIKIQCCLMSLKLVEFVSYHINRKLFCIYTLNEMNSR